MNFPSNEYAFITVKNKASMTGVTVNNTLTVMTAVNSNQNITLDSVTATDVQIGPPTGIVPETAAALTMLPAIENTLSITETNIVCGDGTGTGTGTMTIASAFAPAAGITTTATFPALALNFTSGVLTSATSPSASIQVATANVSVGSSDDHSFALPLVATGTYNFVVDWGDGSSSTITAYNQPEITHLYASTGTYTLQITGTLTGWVFNGSGDKLKILNINSWGDLVLGDAGETGFFYGCSNLTISASAGDPLRPGTTTLALCFQECTSLNSTNVATWDVSAVTDLSFMFYGCSVFNVDLSSWNTSNVTTTSNMFFHCDAFNNGVLTNAGGVPLTWDTGNLLDASNMFTSCAAFNQQVEFSDVSALTTAYSMFAGCTLFNNGDIANVSSKPLVWDVAALQSTVYMLSACSAFNQPLTFTNTNNIISMAGMLSSSNLFKQDVSAWTITSCGYLNGFYSGDLNNPDSTANQDNYDALLLAWSAQTVQSGLTFDMGTTQYSTGAAAARAVLTDTYGWTINDGGMAPSTTLFSINTANISTGSSDDQSFALPLVAAGTYNFEVAWGDGSSSTITAYNQPEVVHLYAATGTYTLQITGTITGWSFNAGGDKLKVLNISKWGPLVIGAAGETGCFSGCSNLTISPGVLAGSPVTPDTTSLFACFVDCTSLNSTNVSTWDVSTVQDISYMFRNCSSFNVDMSSWDTSAVESMINTFERCSSFNNGDPSNAGAVPFTWNTNAVIDMSNMFIYCTAFNQTITLVGAVGPVDMTNMLEGCSIFNNGDTLNAGLHAFTLPPVTSVAYLFLNCPVFNQTIVFGDTALLANVVSMCEGATLFNNGAVGNVGGIDMDFGGASNILFADAIFTSCTSFNQTVTFGNTNTITGMSLMFFGCSIFNNGDITNANSKPFTWDVAALQSTRNMFNGCIAFNQALNFTNTNTISNMSGMLNGCNLFKQNVFSTWVVTACGNFSNFYSGDLNDPDSATNQDNYDALLSAWSLQPLLFGLTLDIGSSKYSAATVADRAILTGTYGWTINDGGLA